MNTSQITVEPSVVQEAVRAPLDAENYDRNKALLFNRIVPESMIPAGTKYWEDPDVLIDGGEPSTWQVCPSEVEGCVRLCYADRLDCTVKDCNGHDINEAYAWEDLRHTVRTLEFSIGHAYFFETVDGPAAFVHIDWNDELDSTNIAEAEAFIREALDAIESVKAHL